MKQMRIKVRKIKRIQKTGIQMTIESPISKGKRFPEMSRKIEALESIFENLDLFGRFSVSRYINEYERTRNHTDNPGETRWFYSLRSLSLRSFQFRGMRRRDQ